MDIGDISLAIFNETDGIDDKHTLLDEIGEAIEGEMWSLWAW